MVVHQEQKPYYPQTKNLADYFRGQLDRVQDSTYSYGELSLD